MTTAEERARGIAGIFIHVQLSESEADLLIEATAKAIREAIREAEQAAYERAAKLCGPHKDDDRMDRQIKAQIAQSIRALGKQEA